MCKDKSYLLGWHPCTVRVWRSGDKWGEWASFHRLCSALSTLAIRIGGKSSYPLSYLAWPQAQHFVKQISHTDLSNSNSDPNKVAVLSHLSTMMKPRPRHAEKAGHGHAINPLGYELKASLFHQQGRFGILLGDLLKCSGHVENNQWINRRCGSPSAPHNTDFSFLIL